MMMDSRPTLVYDGSIPWRTVGDGDQILVDAIRDHGAIVRVKAREQMYTETCVVRPTNLARWSVHCEAGAVFGIGEGGSVGRFVLNVPTPGDPIGILELYGLDQRGGNGVSQERGHLLLVDSHLSGLDHPRGGDSGVFGSNSHGVSQFSVFVNTDGDYHGSHNCYMEGTACVVIGGKWHSADPRRGDARANQYDSMRFLSPYVVMIGTQLFTTDPDSDVPDEQRGHSSMVLGLVGAQRGWFKDVTFHRTGPSHHGARYMVSPRCRQSVAGANRKYVGAVPAPGDQIIPALPDWAYFAPYETNEHGGPLNQVWARNPAFFEPDYWRLARAAAIATPEQMFRNPHCFAHVFSDCTWINHGSRAVGLFGEGTAPVGPGYSRGALHNPPRAYPRTKQDDYLDLPPEWFERSLIVNRRPTFLSDGDESEPFARYVARDASLFPAEDRLVVDGSGIANDTTVKILEGDPAWLPDSPGFDVLGFADVFPDYAHHLTSSTDHRKATEQRRAVDRRL